MHEIEDLVDLIRAEVGYEGGPILGLNIISRTLLRHINRPPSPNPISSYEPSA